MRQVDVFTLVPEAFAWFLDQHPVAEAVSGGLLRLSVHNIRDYSTLGHRQVDDTPCGGGPGMVLRVDVMAAALEGVFGCAPGDVRTVRDVVMLTPGGRPFDDDVASGLACAERDLVLLCGRYEGFDARVSELFAGDELSLGPFVLAGGEVAAMAVIEAMARKIPGVLGNEESPVEESFSPGLGGAVEYPHYTRPREFMGLAVPEVLLSGNHAAIASWRHEHARPSQWSVWAEDKLHSVV